MFVERFCGKNIISYDGNDHDVMTMFFLIKQSIKT